MISVRLNSIHIGATGALTFQWSDGGGTEYSSWADVMSENAGQDQAGTDSIDHLKQLLVSWWLAHDPGANDPALIEGKTMTLDFLSDVPLTVT